MRIVSAGRVPKDPNWRMDAHAHPFLEVICFYEGRGLVWVDDRRYTPRAGSVLVYRPGEVHREHSDPRSPQETVFIGVASPHLPPHFETHLWDETGEIRWLSQALLREVAYDGPASPLAQCYLDALLHLLRRAAAKRRGPALAIDWQEEARRFIDENYADASLDRRKIADAVGVSVSTLTCGFQKRFGVTPGRYVQKVRLEKAAEELAQTDKAVKEIALSVGFNDPLYFSRAFRKRYGCDPTTYRG